MNKKIGYAVTVLILITTTVLALLAVESGCDRDDAQQAKSDPVKPASQLDPERFSPWPASFYFDDPQVVELCLAIKRYDIETVEQLISQGVDINTKGKKNMTPLMWTVPLIYVELLNIRFKYVRKAGEHARFTDSPELTLECEKESLQAFRTFVNNLEKLLQLGSNPDIQLSDGVTMPWILYYAPAGASVSNIATWTLMGKDYSFARYSLLPVVIKYTADPDLTFPIEYKNEERTIRGDVTPIFNVVNPGFHYIASQERGYGPGYRGVPQNLGLLIEAGADIEFQAPEGMTPLLAAAACVHYDMVYMLLCAGADQEHKNHENETLLSLIQNHKGRLHRWLSELDKKHGPNRPKEQLDQSESAVSGDSASQQWYNAVSKDPWTNPTYFLKVIDWLHENDPSMHDELDRLKSEVEAMYRDEFQIDIEQLEYDPWAEEWGNERLKLSFPKTVSDQ